MRLRNKLKKLYYCPVKGRYFTPAARKEHILYCTKHNGFKPHPETISPPEIYQKLLRQKNTMPKIVSDTVYKAKNISQRYH